MVEGNTPAIKGLGRESAVVFSQFGTNIWKHLFTVITCCLLAIITNNLEFFMHSFDSDLLFPQSEIAKILYL